MNKLPNILLIICHDLGRQLGCYGQDPLLESPHLDAFAEAGVRFTQNFATATFCSPSRGAIITGQYPHTNGLMGLCNLGWDMPDTSMTLPAVLGRNGYETHLFGFQHETREDLSRFDHVAESKGHSCKEVVPGLVDFVRSRRADEQKPFFAQVGFGEVHRPGLGSTFIAKGFPVPDPAKIRPLPYLPDTEDLRIDMSFFYENIRFMDHHLGMVFDSVASSPIGNDTVVIFTTDHGEEYPKAKGTVYDSGIGTALIMRWPAGFEGGQVVSDMVSNIDLYPTLLEATGIPVPESVQGRSFLPRLQGRAWEARAEIFAEKNTSIGDAKRCIRTDQYKLIRNFDLQPKVPLAQSNDAQARTHGDLHDYPRPALELYDLSVDPLETVNLAEKTELADVRDDLAGRLDDFLGDTKDPVIGDGVKRPAIEAELMDGVRARRHQVEVKEFWTKPEMRAKP